MSSKDKADSFTGLVDDKGQKARPRMAAHGGQADKNRENRAALADGAGKLSKDTKSRNFQAGDEINFDLDMGRVGKDGTLDLSSKQKRQHFADISENVEDIERKMMADAPKAQEGQYKVDDIFDQSYKELMKGGSSIMSGSIAAQKEGDDEFDF